MLHPHLPPPAVLQRDKIKNLLLLSYCIVFELSARVTNRLHKNMVNNFLVRVSNKKSIPSLCSWTIIKVSNLYKYMATNEIGKIIQGKCPAPLYNSIKLSIRNTENLIILPNKSMPHNQSFNISCSTWNMLIRRLNIPNPLNIVPCILKYKLKRYLLQIQSEGDPDTWNPNS